MKRTALRARSETTRVWHERTRETMRQRAATEPARSAPLRRRGKRASAAHDEAFGPQSDLCRRLPCETCLAETYGVHLRGDVTDTVIERLLWWAEREPGLVPMSPAEPHHFPCRPIGRDKDAGPECRRHHAEWHDALGARGHARKYRIDLRRVRAALATWLAEQGAA
jgi:hypothetical protein